MTEPIVLQPGEGRTFPMGPDPVRVLVEPSASGGAFAIVEAAISPGVPGPPPHIHTDGLEELWYVLDGELEFMVGETTIRAGRGGFAHVPAGTLHTFANPGNETARWIGIFRPASGLVMIEQVAEVLAVPGEPDVARLMEVFATHGVEVPGAPP